jgi:hypothetical protein
MAESGRVDDLLAVTRACYRAPPGARERVWSELTASAAPGGDLGAEGRGSGGVADAARRLPDARVSGVSKPTAALLAGLTFVAGFWLGGRPGRETLVSASASSASAPASTTPSPAAPSASAPPLPSPTQSNVTQADVGATVGTSAVLQAAPPAERTSKRKRSGETASPARHHQQRASSTDGELTLLQRADHAIRSGEPELALSFLADLERRHPETQLGEERSAARLMARCALPSGVQRDHGDDEARAEAQRFLQHRHASVYADRVRELCGLTR